MFGFTDWLYMNASEPQPTFTPASNTPVPTFTPDPTPQPTQQPTGTPAPTEPPILSREAILEIAELLHEIASILESEASK
jgi:hypothetical protein